MYPKYQIYKHAWVYKYAPHTEEALTPSDAQELLRKGGWFVRNTYGFDCMGLTVGNKPRFGMLSKIHSES